MIIKGVSLEGVIGKQPPTHQKQHQLTRLIAKTTPSTKSQPITPSKLYIAFITQHPTTSTL